MTLKIAAIFFSAASLVSAQELKTEQDKTLYALGLVLGRNISEFKLSSKEFDHVAAGLRDSVMNKKPRVDIDVYGPKIQELATSRAASAAQKRKDSEKGFLANAGKEKGAKAFPSGLILTELKAGKGASPKATDTVRAHYRGTLVDGTEFDSSYARGEPADFPLDGVIPCWTEGLQKMKIDGKAKLVCPSAIAYGDRGRPPVIPGGAVLVFEVELKDILKKEETGKK